MTHNTQIVKRDGDIETIFNTGRTNDGEIYIDIRVYKTGDVIDVGDITITQKEYDQINDTLGQNPAQDNLKRFKCPECGDIVTEDDILEDLTTGGFGMCLCLFGNGQRTLVRYEPYISDELTPSITPAETELIRTVRNLCGE